MAVARWWVRWSWAIRAANGESRGKVVGGGARWKPDTVMHVMHMTRGRLGARLRSWMKPLTNSPP